MQREHCTLHVDAVCSTEVINFQMEKQEAASG